MSAVPLGYDMTDLVSSLNEPVSACFLIVSDIHALPEQFYVKDKVQIRLRSAVPVLLRELQSWSMMPTIVYPDDGAAKRFQEAFPEMAALPSITCHKKRGSDGNRRVVLGDRLYVFCFCISLGCWPSVDLSVCVYVCMSRNFPRNEEDAWRHVLIVDDLAQLGGTLDECRKALKAAGAKKVSAFVTHAVLPRDPKSGVESHLRFLRGGDRDGLEHFFVADTVPTMTTRLQDQAPYRVLSLAPSVARNLLAATKTPVTARQILPMLPRSIHLASQNPDKVCICFGRWWLFFVFLHLDIYMSGSLVVVVRGLCFLCFCILS